VLPDDLDAAIAVISRRVTVIDNLLRIKELPKTNVGQTIRLDPATSEMLRRVGARQNEEKLLMSADYQDDGSVFTQADGTVLHPDQFSRQFLRKQNAHNRDHPEVPFPTGIPSTARPARPGIADQLQNPDRLAFSDSDRCGHSARRLFT
jgi:hypothetical protein